MIIIKEGLARKAKVLKAEILFRSERALISNKFKKGECSVKKTESIFIEGMSSSYAWTMV